MYKLGKGVQPSHENAAYWYEQAVQQGFALARTQLGLACRGGSVFAKDFQKALYWFRQAAMQQNGQARAGIGIMFANGEEVARNDVTAYAWPKLAAQNGFTLALDNLEKAKKTHDSQ